MSMVSCHLEKMSRKRIHDLPMTKLLASERGSQETQRTPLGVLGRRTAAHMPLTEEVSVSQRRPFSPT